MIDPVIMHMSGVRKKDWEPPLQTIFKDIDANNNDSKKNSKRLQNVFWYGIKKTVLGKQSSSYIIRYRNILSSISKTIV